MDFIQSANKQVDKFGSGKHGFSAGNPSGGIPATYMTPEWCDNVQQEIVNVIEGAGISIAPGSKTQLYQAIQALIAGATGNDYKASVRYTTTGNVTLSGLGTQAGGDWPGALTAGDRILVKDNTTGSQNGLYIAAAGAWVRATDADGAGELTSGALISVEEGTVNADSLWMLTTDGTITIGTTSLVFERKDGAIPQNSQSANYTLQLSDANKHLMHPSADTTARTFTVPANASVPFKVGTAVTFVNQNAAGSLTIAITSDTMRLAGSGATGSRTLAANGIATALKVGPTEWIISGTGLS